MYNGISTAKLVSDLIEMGMLYRTCGKKNLPTPLGKRNGLHDHKTYTGEVTCAEYDVQGQKLVLSLLLKRYGKDNDK